MLVLTLTQRPNPFSHPVFEQLLSTKDALLLTSTTLSLAFNSNVYRAQGYVRSNDASLLPGRFHNDWLIIDDEQWSQLLIAADKVVSW